MAPVVSLLMPVRNGASTLAAAVASVRAQTRPCDELVIVDDGSTDNTLAIARRATAEVPGARVLARPAEGLIPALNTGLADCRGTWILRMDADDLSHHRRVEKQLALAMSVPGLDVIGCGVRIFPRRAMAEGFRLYEGWLNSLQRHEDIAREAFVESPLAHPSVMLRRSAVQAVDGWHDHGWAEDYDLWLRLLARGSQFAKVPEPLLLWRDGSDRLTRTDERYSRMKFLEAKAHYLAAGPLRDKSVVVWGAGRIGGQIARLLEERHGVSIHAFIDIDPAKIGSVRRGRPIVGVQDLPGLAEHTLLAAVGRRGARQLIRAQLDDLGRIEGQDYWVVA